MYLSVSRKAKPLKSFFPWIVFFGGLSIEIIIDYILRIISVRLIENSCVRKQILTNN